MQAKNQYNPKLNTYLKNSKADKYIIVFIDNEEVYYTIQNTILHRQTYTTNASTKKNKEKKLMFKFLLYDKEKAIKQNQAVYLCSLNDFKQIQAINDGWRSEVIIYKYFDIPYKGMDNIPFYKGSDITINDIDYQIKFQRSQIATYKTLNRLQ